MRRVSDATGHQIFDTTVKQAAVLGLGRSTAWVVLNADTRAGPSASVVKRILSSSRLSVVVRQKVQEYVRDKSGGLYGHSRKTVNTAIICSCVAPATKIGSNGPRSLSCRRRWCLETGTAMAEKDGLKMPSACLPGHNTFRPMTGVS